jgi:hypothetical protein
MAGHCGGHQSAKAVCAKSRYVGQSGREQMARRRRECAFGKGGCLGAERQKLLLSMILENRRGMLYPQLGLVPTDSANE